MTVTVPAAPVDRLGDAWRACVGTGRFDLSLRAEHRDALRLVQQQIGFRHVRGHGMLSDLAGVHRAYSWDGTDHEGRCFTYLDRVVDGYLDLGVRPFPELGFTPADLASGDRTVFWWRGNVTPPRDLAAWARLVRDVTAHLVDRYGADEVRTWPFEVWNEPDLEQFWDGDADAYHRLYAASARAVKEVDAAIPVGGPATSPATDAWMRPFAEFAAREGVPVDFVSRHAYSSGPARRLPFGVRQSLAPAGRLLEQFASPRAELAGTALADVPVHVTEYNSSYHPLNPVHDTAFHAAYLAPVVTSGGGGVASYSYWTLCDEFEEQGVPPLPFHGGFGLVAGGGIRKPTFHLYAFTARLGDEVLARGDDHVVTRHPDGRLAVIAWAPVDLDGAPSPGGHRVRLSLPVAGGDGGELFAVRTRVADGVGDPYGAWCAMGRPPAPSRAEQRVLRDADEPARGFSRIPVAGGRAGLDLVLDRHEVTLVELSHREDRTPHWWDDDLLRGPGDGQEG